MGRATSLGMITVRGYHGGRTFHTRSLCLW